MSSRSGIRSQAEFNTNLPNFRLGSEIVVKMPFSGLSQGVEDMGEFFKSGIYLRCSTAKQDLHGQERVAREFLEGKDGRMFQVWDTERGWYRDHGISGAKSDRPELTRLMADARQGQFNAIVVVQPDRLTRLDELDFVLFKSQVRDLGLRIFSINQRSWLDPGDMASNIVWTIQNLMASIEREKMKINTHRGMWDKTLSDPTGRKNFVGGRPGYGYTMAEDRTVIEHPEEADVVREIFRLYIQDKRSMIQITEHLNKMGAPVAWARKGWHNSAVSNILRNPVYYQGEWHRSKKDPATGEKTAIVIQVPKLIDTETWEEAVFLRETRRTSLKPGRKQKRYLCSSLIRCPSCGRRLIVQGPPTHRYYRCLGRKKIAGCDCPAPPTPYRTDRIDAQIWAVLEDAILKHPEVIEAIIDEATNTHGIRHIEEQLKRIEADLKKRQQAQGNVAQKLLAVGVLDEAGMEAVAGLKAEIDTLKRERDVLKQRLADLDTARQNRASLKRQLGVLRELFEEIREDINGKWWDLKREIILDVAGGKDGGVYLGIPVYLDGDKPYTPCTVNPDRTVNIPENLKSGWVPGIWIRGLCDFSAVSRLYLNSKKGQKR